MTRFKREAFINSQSKSLSKGNPVLESTAQTILRRAYTPLNFFPLYMEAAAEQGINLESFHNSSNTTHKAPSTGIRFWAFLGLELLLVCSTAIYFVWQQAVHPFCTSCDSWHGVELTASFLHPNQTDEAVHVVTKGQWHELSGLSGLGATTKSNCEVVFCQCPGCANGHVSVKQNSNSKIQIAYSRSISPNDVKTLEGIRANWLESS